MQSIATLFRGKEGAIGRLLVLLALLFTVTATGFATIDITDVEGKQEKRKNSATGKDETWVVITYSISDVPNDGATVDMEATFSAPNGNSFTVAPLEGEMSGAVGAITGNGSKTIEWNVEKTLVRLGKQGKYKCVADLKIEGSEGATRAVLTVSSYAGTSWKYFSPGTAEITNLTRTGTFTPSCPSVQGGNWQSTVEAGAVFYKGEVTQIPAWRGRRANDVITGAPSTSGCSAFLAIKNQGKADEKIWVNFAKLNNMKLDNDRDGNPEKAFQWEFQFRYYGSKKDGAKALKAGNAGEPGQDQWTEWNQGEGFELELSSAPAEEEKSEKFDVEVVRREFRYSYQGKEVMLFKALGDGYFDPDPDLGPNVLTLKSGDMSVNDWLSFSGSFSIDTTTDHGSITSTGAWANGKGDVLWVGDFLAKLTDQMSRDVAIGARSIKLAEKWKIGGFAVLFDGIKFIGGVDHATGITMDIQLLIDQLESGCKYDREKGASTGSEVAGIRLVGVKMSDEGWDLKGIEVQNLSLSVAPTFCLKTLTATYDKEADTVSASILVGCPLFEEIGGGFMMRKAQLENLRLTMKLGSGIPLPDPPPPFHVIEWKGFDCGVSNMKTGPLTFDGTLFFANNSKWQDNPIFSEVKAALQELPGVDLSKVSIFELSGTGKIVMDQSLTGGLALKVYKLTDNFWLGEGSVSTTLDIVKLGIRLDGALKFANFGGSKWLIEGTGAGEISLRNGFNFQAQIRADLYVPDILSSNAFWALVNRKVGLPYKVSGIGITLQNLTTWFDLELPYFGTTGFIVNLGKSPLSDPWGFIHPTTGVPQLNATRRGDHKSILSAGDTTWTTFTVGPNAEKVFADVWNSSTAPSSVLVDPTGTIYTGTVADSSVILWPETHPGMGTLWALKNPRPGEWNLGVIGMKSGDSTSVFAIDRKPSAFQLTSQAAGREVVARWNGAGASDSSRIALYLDDDDKGFDGTYIGSVKESAGEFHFMMTDTLPLCGYYLYGMRVGSGGDGSMIYSETYHPNPKSSLFPPVNIRAVATPAGDVTVTWEKTSEPGVLQYLIRVTDKDGHDSIYAPVDFNYTMATIHVDDWQTKKISMVSRNDGNRQGCWSDPVSFALAAVEDRINGGDRPVGIEVFIAPQPVTTRTTVYANLTRSARLTIDLYDMEGRKVMPLKEGIFEPGTVRAEIDAAMLPSGVYIVRIAGDGISASRKITVRK